ncbi:aconitate hydratase AcnA [Pararhodospirillum oryzae]|uniref:Aconitate hydratase n=1 Tax=Pararhodospirillum oryzae TaxID=478448 RepID=A0A512H4M6_9PROT|nr:aconitate hydratase AcnA [Pararhodospirillum oryzae]GEO80419.1 aconitate hydratase [Pararhodospirillum oryzae]
MSLCGQDTLKTRRTLTVNGREVDYFSLEAAGLEGIDTLPCSLKVLLENLLRSEDGRSVTTDDIKAVADWARERRSDREIAFRPARVLMQDFTGVPGVVDLAAMREAMKALGGDPTRINPLSPVDLVIDHSVMIDHFGSADALTRNMALEFERNGERYAFLRWGQKAFNNFRVVPPGVGICHQVNLEYLARGVWTSEEDGRVVAFPDTLVGTDSHTTMINGLGVLGWGVGGIEAEAAMLGQPLSMLIPEVIGFELTGTLREGTTATDLVLRVVEMLRKKGVVGKFVEFYGDGLDALPLTDRATIANMGPEYGATCGFFPIDAETLRYLRFTGRDEDTVALVEAYAKAQGLWRTSGAPAPVFTDTLSLDMGTVEPSLAGPRRPQDRVALSSAAPAFAEALKTLAPDAGLGRAVPVDGASYSLEDGSVVIAAITSCTNTSNPSVMMAAGLLAQKAVARGLTRKPWVKTSLAPGSQVVADYLVKAGVQDALDALGFQIAGFGCTTCIGNAGPLDEPIARAIDGNGLVVGAVLSGNRNFEGRISPHVRANYLASPPLVVAYALAGSLRINLATDPLGRDKDGNEVFLKDIWPTAAEVAAAIDGGITPDMYRSRYANVFDGTPEWQAIEVAEGETYAWDAASTYVQHPPYFQGMSATPAPLSDVVKARPLAILGDSVTTDHISPAGSIKADSPAGQYLVAHGVAKADFNSYGARRGNHEVMMRGTFANIRIRNLMAPGTEGGVTKHHPSGAVMPIYDAAMAYQREGVPLVVIGGAEYGTGSSRDWAAKGTNLLGVKAVIAISFERIHRSNLVGMGVLPLQFAAGVNAAALNLDGTETFTITGLADLSPRQNVDVTLTRADGSTTTFETLCRIDTLDEVDYFRNGGILQTVLRHLTR